MTPLRQQFIDDMRVRNYAPKTVVAFVEGVAGLARHCKRSPDQLGSDEIHCSQLEMIRQLAFLQTDPARVRDKNGCTTRKPWFELIL
jgi:23S rRNA A2030 N6-methylase RlmJ